MAENSPDTQQRPLPLDEGYSEYLHGLNELVRDDPELLDTTAVQSKPTSHASSPVPPRQTLDADPDQLRMFIHIMVLAASELADLHEWSRAWLAAHGRTMPPWDVTVPRTAQRLITFGNKVYGVVEWEPASQLNDDLNEAEQRWATALAIGIGERPRVGRASCRAWLWPRWWSAHISRST
jgi:hypothetical protein